MEIKDECDDISRNLARINFRILASYDCLTIGNKSDFSRASRVGDANLETQRLKYARCVSCAVNHRLEYISVMKNDYFVPRRSFLNGKKITTAR